MYYRRKILLSILERSKNQTITKLSLHARIRISAPHQQKRIILFSSSASRYGGFIKMLKKKPVGASPCACPII